MHRCFLQSVSGLIRAINSSILLYYCMIFYYTFQVSARGRAHTWQFADLSIY